MKSVCAGLLLSVTSLHHAVAPRSFVAAVASPPAWFEVDTTPALLRHLNLYRQQAGLPPLVLSKTACLAARLQATYNLAHHTYGHYHPQYATPRQRLAAVGHAFEHANGFISYGYENCVRFRGMRPANLTGIEGQILRAYKTSPKHQAALLDPHATKVGMATLCDGDELQNSMVFCI